MCHKLASIKILQNFWLTQVDIKTNTGNSGKNMLYEVRTLNIVIILVIIWISIFNFVAFVTTFQMIGFLILSFDKIFRFVLFSIFPRSGIVTIIITDCYTHVVAVLSSLLQWIIIVSLSSFNFYLRRCLHRHSRIMWSSEIIY